MFGSDKVKLPLVVNIRIIIRFYFKNTFPIMESNSKGKFGWGKNEGKFFMNELYV